MCGIVGFTGATAPDLLRDMCNTLRHRGPDDDGYFENPFVSLGMRRLAIVDIAGGKQPVGNENNKIVAVMNGEIYNHKELRKELSESGHYFSSQHSDTEICPHAYEQWGNSWINRTNGMFATAIWDDNLKTLLLYRDRLGKKPLYYTQIGDNIAFASEIKALLRHPMISKELDYDALGQYFALKSTSAPASAYKYIRQLEPGQMLAFHKGNLSIESWWKADFSPIDDITVDEAAKRIRFLLEDAVNLRMQCDVPFGAYLSGGVDSSSVVAIMSCLHNRPIQTFCLGYSDGKSDQMMSKASDVTHAREVSAIFDTQHHELFLSSLEFRDAMPKVISAFDEPFSGAVSTYFLSTLIAKHVTVALSGDGADELFASYLPHRLSLPMSRYLANPERYSDNSTNLHELAPFDSEGQFSFLRRIASSKHSEWYDKISVFNHEERRSLLNPDIFSELDTKNPYTRFDCNYSACDFLNRTLEIDQHELLPNQVLAFVDRLSMTHSIEVRCPYLDFRLVEFVNRLPGNFKIHNGVNKFILKKAMGGLIPDAVINRPKEGFVQPIYTWMNKELHDWIMNLLDELPQELFQKEYLNSLVKTWNSGSTDLNAKIWNLACFSLWWNIK